jgi:hypothetical protein
MLPTIAVDTAVRVSLSDLLNSEIHLLHPHDGLHSTAGLQLPNCQVDLSTREPKCPSVMRSEVTSRQGPSTRSWYRCDAGILGTMVPVTIRICQAAEVLFVSEDEATQSAISLMSELQFMETRRQRLKLVSWKRVCTFLSSEKR